MTSTTSLSTTTIDILDGTIGSAIGLYTGPEYTPENDIDLRACAMDSLLSVLEHGQRSWANVNEALSGEDALVTLRFLSRLGLVEVVEDELDEDFRRLYTAGFSTRRLIDTPLNDKAEANLRAIVDQAYVTGRVQEEAFDRTCLFASIVNVLMEISTDDEDFDIYSLPLGVPGSILALIRELLTEAGLVKVEDDAEYGALYYATPAGRNLFATN